MHKPVFKIFATLGLAGAAMLASAGEVVLYSSNNVDAINNVVTAFGKAHPDIKVSVVRAGSGALMQRIKAEAANPLGDIFWSGGLSTISQYGAFLQPYSSTQLSAVSADYQSAEQLWFPTNTHVTVLMLNERQLPAGEPPEGWRDLTDPKWKGKIAVTDPEVSSASYVALYGIRQVMGDEGLAAIARNAVIVGTTSAAYDGVAKGEFAAAITMEYAGYEYVAGGLKEIRLVYPKEGTFLSPEGMALIKGGKNPDEARKLYEFLASAQAQTDIFKQTYRRPLRQDVDVRTLSALPALADIKIARLDDKAMGEERAAFLARWRELTSKR